MRRVITRTILFAACCSLLRLGISMPTITGVSNAHDFTSRSWEQLSKWPDSHFFQSANTLLSGVQIQTSPLPVSSNCTRFRRRHKPDYYRHSGQQPRRGHVQHRLFQPLWGRRWDNYVPRLVCRGGHDQHTNAMQAVNTYSVELKRGYRVARTCSTRPTTLLSRIPRLQPPSPKRRALSPARERCRLPV